jgi:hypothetical protein
LSCWLGSGPLGQVIGRRQATMKECALPERALAIIRPPSAPPAPNVAIGLNNLALILQDFGKLEAARPLQEHALAITSALQAARPRILAEKRQMGALRLRCPIRHPPRTADPSGSQDR